MAAAEDLREKMPPSTQMLLRGSNGWLQELS